MSGINIFEDDWRDCLRAHYAYVIREHDTNNEQSLITVLVQTGFTESDILSMRQEIVVELGWVEPAPPQIEAPAEAPEAIPQFESAPDVQDEQVALLEAAPDVIGPGDAAPDYPPIPGDVALFLDAASEVEAAPDENVTLLEEEIADAELSAEEEAMLTLSEAEPELQIVALELPLDAPAPLDNPIAPPESAPDATPRTAAPLPERKPEKKKPKKTQQMSLF